MLLGCVERLASKFCKIPVHNRDPRRHSEPTILRATCARGRPLLLLLLLRGMLVLHFVRLLPLHRLCCARHYHMYTCNAIHMRRVRAFLKTHIIPTHTHGVKDAKLRTASAEDAVYTQQHIPEASTRNRCCTLAKYIVITV